MEDSLKNQQKMQKKLQSYIEKGKPLKIKKMKSFFMSNFDEGASILEHTTHVLVKEKTETHDHITALYHFLLHSKESLWFSLYFECLLANEPLYRFLLSGFGHDSHESFYHQMITLAEKHPTPSGKETALSILLVLYDSLSGLDT